MTIETSYILGILNAERTLQECLEGILMQEYDPKKYEILVVDGGSTDKTLEIVENYRRKHKNIKLMHNPKKLSEGKGMSKDMGVMAAKGEFVVFLDHDNIILDRDWINNILKPFKEDKDIMASQSKLDYLEGDSAFLKYVNAVGFEDPFAIPYSLVAQVQLYPEKFIKKNGYYEYRLDRNNDLFFGANGCAFRKELFSRIGGYTRDNDVSASMAKKKMKVAVPIVGRVYHKTANSFSSFLRKKGIYFFRLLDYDYKVRKFNWIKPGIRGKIKFSLMVLLNISLSRESIRAINQMRRRREGFWVLHPFYVMFMTLEYIVITPFRFKNFLKYARKSV